MQSSPAFAAISADPKAFAGLANNQAALAAFTKNAGLFSKLGGNPAFAALTSNPAFAAAVQDGSFAMAMDANLRQ
jgi:hypothetical protein